MRCHKVAHRTEQWLRKCFHTLATRLSVATGLLWTFSLNSHAAENNHGESHKNNSNQLSYCRSLYSALVRSIMVYSPAKCLADNGINPALHQSTTLPPASKPSTEILLYARPLRGTVVPLRPVVESKIHSNSAAVVYSIPRSGLGSVQWTRCPVLEDTNPLAHCFDCWVYRTVSRCALQQAIAR